MAFEDTRLWSEALGKGSEPWGAEVARERLRAAFGVFRERSAMLASEIARDLPSFTRHDISHVDALWELADVVGGPKIVFTPTEAFVFGGACLLHDLGLAVAAYPDGPSSLQSDPLWRDSVALILMRDLGRTPTYAEIDAASSSTRDEATTLTLRERHARQAEHLALTSWVDGTTSERLYLLTDDDLRMSYGAAIGRIAHSHWWGAKRVGEELAATLGMPAWCPTTWVVDPLKIASVLRAADGAHLDATRAPRFLRAIRTPSAESDSHWAFQAKLLRPQIRDDRLVFTAGAPFTRAEARAWWLCWDVLRELDRELGELDSVLVDLARTRLDARGVLGADAPSHLAELVPTSDWVPVDARIHVSDVADLVKILGGEELYGRDPRVPLRELIQNSRDAIVARRLIESRDSTWGEITVEFGADNGESWIAVSDNGVGMSRSVMSNSLLDFGTSFWRTRAAITEYPGLLGAGFAPIGTFGIGFFSVFMWGARIRVISRRYDSAQAETNVLEFTDGASQRPLLRQAQPDERMHDGGTQVRVWLDAQHQLDDVLASPATGSIFSQSDLLSWLCPSLDVTLGALVDGTRMSAVEAGDWRTLEPERLVSRIYAPLDETGARHARRSDVSALAPHMRELRDSSGGLVGRAFISPFQGVTYRGAGGVVTVGGLRATQTQNLIGILAGANRTTARNVAIPVVEPIELARWATEQAVIAAASPLSADTLARIAEIVNTCGGALGELPIVESTDGWLTYDQLGVYSRYGQIVLYQDAAYHLDTRYGGDFELNENVLVVGMGGGPLLDTDWRLSVEWWPDGGLRSIQDLVIERLAEAWSSSVADVLEASQMSTDEHPVFAEVGKRHDEPVLKYANVIRKP